MALVIDGFDTLVSCPWTQIREQLARHLSVPPERLIDGLSATQIDRNLGAYRTEVDEMQALLDWLGLDRLLARTLSELNRRLVGTMSAPYVDSINFLASCKAYDIPVAVLSNCSPSAMAAFEVLEDHVPHEMMLLSWRIGTRKPEAAAFVTARRLLGDACRYLLIDDNPEFCNSALAAGFEAVQIKRETRDADYELDQGLPHVSSLRALLELRGYVWATASE